MSRRSHPHDDQQGPRSGAPLETGIKQMANDLVVVTKTYSIIRVERTGIQGRPDPMRPIVVGMGLTLDEVVKVLREITRLNIQRAELEKRLERAKQELWTSALATRSGTTSEGGYYEYWVQPE